MVARLFSVNRAISVTDRLEFSFKSFTLSINFLLMKNQLHFFFEIQKIIDFSCIFDELKKHGLFFSYFQIDHKYYLFFYGDKFIETYFLYQAVDVIQELDTKKRKIRSLRGFFLYALEIMVKPWFQEKILKF